MNQEPNILNFHINPPSKYEKNKDESWYKNNAAYYVSLCLQGSHSKDLYNYRRWDGHFDENDFEYITNDYGNEYPATIKPIPLIRPIFERLLGEALGRIRRYYARVINHDGVFNKYQDQIKDTFENLIKDVTKKLQEQTKATLKQQAQQEEKIDFLIEEEMKSFDDFKSQDFVTHAEASCQKLSKMIEYKHHIKKKMNELLLDAYLTGKMIYRWYVPDGMRDPVLKVVNPVNFYFDGETEFESINQGFWAVEVVPMSVNEILDKFGNKLTFEQRRKILDENFVSQATINGRKIYDSTINDLEDYEPMYNGTGNDRITVDVYYVEWIAYEQVDIVEFINENGLDSSFLHVYEEGAYNKLEPSKKNRVKDKKKKEIAHRYECTIIGSDIFTDWKRCEYVSRSNENINFVGLSYNGLVFRNHNSTEPFSLYSSVIALEDLYRIIYYHRERMIAVSGTKGTMLDTDSMPSYKGRPLSLKEVIYYKKLGLWLISSSSVKNGFNQFQTFDDGLSASVQILKEILDSIELQCQQIHGLNPQRMGDIGQKDLVGAIDAAVRQSAFSTESLFYALDFCYKMIIQDGIQIYQKCWRKKKSPMGNYVLGNGRTEIFYMDKNFFMEDYGIFYEESETNEKKMNDLRQIVGKMAENGKIDLKTILKVFSDDGIRETYFTLQKDLTEYEKMQQKLQEQQGQVEGEKAKAEQKFQLDKIRLESQLQKEIKELELQEQKAMNERNAELEEKKIELKNRELDQKERLAERQLDIENKEASAKKAGNSVETKDVVKIL